MSEKCTFRKTKLKQIDLNVILLHTYVTFITLIHLSTITHYNFPLRSPIVKSRNVIHCHTSCIPAILLLWLQIIATQEQIYIRNLRFIHTGSKQKPRTALFKSNLKTNA